MIFTEIYAIFGHGIRSAAMNTMFLVPLVGGALPFALRRRWLCVRQDGRPVHRNRLDRLAFNGYHAGIATLAVASLLTGVFEIAGTTSPYPAWFRGLGLLLAAGSLLRLWLRRPDRRRNRA